MKGIQFEAHTAAERESARGKSLFSFFSFHHYSYLYQGWENKAQENLNRFRGERHLKNYTEKSFFNHHSRKRKKEGEGGETTEREKLYRLEIITKISL